MIKILFFLLCICSIGFSKNLDVSNLENIKALEYTYFINDKENKYTYLDIKNKTDLKALEVTHIGPAVGPFWTKISLHNDSNEVKSITLYNLLAGINKIDVYLIKNDELIKTIYLGDLRPQEKRENLSSYSNFNLILNPKEAITIISKIENFHIYNLGWEVLESDDFFTKHSNKIFFSAFIGGIVLLFCIYNILNFFIYKNKSYLIICAIGLTLTFYQYSFHGIFYFLNMNINLELITCITWISPLIAGIFILLFAYTFFEQAKKYKKFSYVNIFFMISYILLISLLIYAQFFNQEYFKYSWLITLIILSSTSYLLAFAIYVVIKKEIGSIYYLLGEGILFVVIFFNTLGLFSIISYDESLKFLIPFAYILDLLSFVIVLYLKNKQEQTDLRNTRILLLEQSRFNSIGQAVGHISHQWKSPLTSIGTSLTLLETIYKHDISRFETTFDKQLPLMKKSVNLMKKSMDEFSNFYQTKNKKEVFLFSDSLSNIVEILSSKIILKKVEINYEIEENLKINSYEHILSNIFLVLIDNSLDAFTLNENNFIKISAFTKEKEIIISYEDNAGGIKIKPIESAFDYFTSLKNDKKSSGMGLAIVKLLINDRLKGKISVKNSEFGVIFTIII